MRVLVFVAALMCAGGAWAQEAETPPTACRQDAQGRVDYAACAEAAPVGSGWWRLAKINLGTQAFAAEDYAAAVRHYDEAQPPGGSERLYSDASFHAFRASAYQHVGREDEALADARLALGMLNNDPSLPESARSPASLANVDREIVYAVILPVLKEGSAPELAAAREAYLALPIRDWISAVNRAGVLEQLDELNAALDANAFAMQMAPGHPAPLNNQCYILTRAGRAREALPFCAQAVAAAGEVAAVRHSNAAALAGAGRCTESAAELDAARRLDPVSVAYQQPIACSGAAP